MNLNELAKRHIEQLVAAIEQSKQTAAAHRAKAEELDRQVKELESEKETWTSAVGD